MQQLNALKQVAEFHKTFKHPILDQPTIPDPKRSRLRVELISEELKELEQAIKDNDLIEVADALCDIQYVLCGAILEFGMGGKFKELFDEVQRSNMSKACRSEEEAKTTVAHYENSKQTPCYYKEIDGKWLVYRTSDQKTLKSTCYSPADLKSILNK